MVLLLPRSVDGLPALEQALTPDSLGAWLQALRPREIHTVLPKFKFTAELQLKHALETLGMLLAFSAGADFSGMNDTASRGVEAPLEAVTACGPTPAGDAKRRSAKQNEPAQCRPAASAPPFQEVDA